jgi:hypothetical protein
MNTAIRGCLVCLCHYQNPRVAFGVCFDLIFIFFVFLIPFTARLDPDGNAIASDEEEELERSCAEYRVRALYQARASVTSAGQNMI